MKKSELKNILKPLVKECIQEALIEEGFLSTVVSEVVKGLGSPTLIEAPRKDTLPQVDQKHVTEEQNRRRAKIEETRKQMLDAIGNSTYNGVDLFEGTTPMRGDNGTQHGALSGTDPGDAGVDISNLMGNNKRVWNALLEGKK
jgi:hypothetical protein